MRIPIEEIAGRLNHASRGKRLMAMLWFYCDESADQPSHLPKNYCVAGLLGEEQTFRKLERGWERVNQKVGVKRYHAAPMNSKTGEYEGWTKEKSDDYSARLMKLMKMRGHDLQVTSIGIHSDDYRETFTKEAQERFGHPYIACFKSCIMMIAAGMGRLPWDWKLSVIFERNKELNDQIIKAFYDLKDLDPDFGHRLATCTPGQWDENIALQPADLVAYESMRLIQNKRTSTNQMRWFFKELMGVSRFMGCYYDRPMLEEIAVKANESQCLPGGWFPMSREWYPEYREGDSWEDVERKRAKR